MAMGRFGVGLSLSRLAPLTPFVRGRVVMGQFSANRVAAANGKACVARHDGGPPDLSTGDSD